MHPTNFTFSSKDGLSLLGRAWVSPTLYPKGIIHLVHGLGEHSGRYDHIGNALANAGYHLASFDLRGHGLSEGPRGHTPDLAHLLDDINQFLQASTKHLGNSLPKFIYGHSLGGNLVINYGIRNHTDFRGAIVTSPSIQTASPPPKAKLSLAKIMANLIPSMTFRSGLEQEALSRNAAIVKSYRDDVYVHDHLTARMGLDLMKSGQLALEHAEQWQKPLLLMHGTNDRITSPAASETFAKKAGDFVEFVLWEDYYHELHNDFGAELVIQKMIDWLNQRVN